MEGQAEQVTDVVEREGGGILGANEGKMSLGVREDSGRPDPSISMSATGGGH